MNRVARQDKQFPSRQRLFIVIGLLILFLFFFSTGCGTSANQETGPTGDLDLRTEDTKQMEDVEVTMRIDQETYTVTDTLTLVIENKGARNIELGWPYTLEKWEDGWWESVQIDVMFTLEARILSPGESFQQEVELTELQPGTYRMSKDVRIDTQNLADDKLELQTKFNIQNEL